MGLGLLGLVVAQVPVGYEAAVLLHAQYGQVWPAKQLLLRVQSTLESYTVKPATPQSGSHRPQLQSQPSPAWKYDGSHSHVGVLVVVALCTSSSPV